MIDDCQAQCYHPVMEARYSCPQCGVVRTYIDENGVEFHASGDHETNDCLLRMKQRNKKLEHENMRLGNEHHYEQNRVKNILERQHLLKAPKEQREKLIDQCRRWQSLYERERIRRLKFRTEIMKVYGMLDFKIETGAIVDPKGLSVAEYVTKKLRELIRNSTK